MAFDKEKLKAVILHTCETCKPSKLGAVKMHKVLYFADMLRYANVARSITGSTYRKRPLGPTCDQLLEALSELQSNELLEIKTVDYFGYQKKEYVAKVKANTNQLSKDEIVLLDEVIKFVCDSNSAQTISEYSHNRAWEMVAFGDEIGYNSVFNIFPLEVSNETKEWAIAEVKRLEAQRQPKTPLGGKILGKFRDLVFQGRDTSRSGGLGRTA